MVNLTRTLKSIKCMHDRMCSKAVAFFFSWTVSIIMQLSSLQLVLIFPLWSNFNRHMLRIILFPAEIVLPSTSGSLLVIFGFCSHVNALTFIFCQSKRLTVWNFSHQSYVMQIIQINSQSSVVACVGKAWETLTVAFAWWFSLLMCINIIRITGLL